MTNARKDKAPRPRFASMLLTHKDPHHVEEQAMPTLELSPGAVFAWKADPTGRPRERQALDDKVDRERGIRSQGNTEGPLA